MSEIDPNICPECGFPKDSRTHQEGLNGIHDRTPAPEAEPEAETEEGSQTRRRSRG